MVRRQGGFPDVIGKLAFFMRVTRLAVEAKVPWHAWNIDVPRSFNALNVPQQTIEADFVASNVYLTSMHEKIYKGMAQAMQLDSAAVRKAMELRPELMQIFFGAITTKYGSIEKFMEQELGVGKKELAVLRKKYTI